MVGCGQIGALKGPRDFFEETVDVNFAFSLPALPFRWPQQLPSRCPCDVQVGGVGVRGLLGWFGALGLEVWGSKCMRLLLEASASP